MIDPRPVGDIVTTLSLGCGQIAVGASVYRVGMMRVGEGEETELKAAVVELATGEDGLHPDAINNTKPITRQTIVFLTIVASLRRILIANWLYLCSMDEEI
jgi:hypothetical protein